MTPVDAPTEIDPRRDGQTNNNAQPGSRIHVRSMQRFDALGRVMSWELRRFTASRIFWVQAFAFFVLLLLITWGQRAPEHFGLGIDGKAVVDLAGTSAWGLLDTLPTTLLLLVLLLPFVNTDGVSRDLKRRTYELVMTTA